MAESTTQQLDGGTRKQIVDKLNKLLSERFDLYPSYNNPDHDDAMRVEIDRWYEKIKVTFDSFGISSAREKVENTYKNLKDQDKLLFVIQLPSRHEGDYLIVAELSDLLEAYIFAYETSDSRLPESASLQQNEYELMETKEAFTNLVVKDEISATPFLSDVDISNAYKMAELYIILHCVNGKKEILKNGRLKFPSSSVLVRSQPSFLRILSEIVKDTRTLFIFETITLTTDTEGSGVM